MLPYTNCCGVLKGVRMASGVHLIITWRTYVATLSAEKRIEIGASDNAVQALTWSLHSSESSAST